MIKKIHRPSKIIKPTMVIRNISKGRKKMFKILVTGKTRGTQSTLRISSTVPCESPDTIQDRLHSRTVCKEAAETGRLR